MIETDIPTSNEAENRPHAQKSLMADIILWFLDYLLNIPVQLYKCRMAQSGEYVPSKKTSSFLNLT